MSATMAARAASARLRPVALVLGWGIAFALERLVQGPAGVHFPGLLLCAVVATAWSVGPVGASVGVFAGTGLALLDRVAQGADALASSAAEPVVVFAIVAAMSAALTVALRMLRAERDALARALDRLQSEHAAHTPSAAPPEAIPAVQAEWQDLMDAAGQAEQQASAAQHELAAAHRMFEAFMSAFPYPAFLQDERGALVFVNEAGRSGTAWYETVGTSGPGEDATPAADDRRYFSIRFPVEVEGRAWLGGIAIDVAERMRTERALSERTAEFKTLFHHVPAPLWIARDAQAKDIEANAAAQALIGTDPGASDAFAARIAVAGQPLAPDEWPIRTCIRERRVVNAVDLESVGADGAPRHIRMTAAPLLDATGAPRGAVAAALDITRLKTYEAELERAVRRRDEFLAVLAHELRNPLTPIQHSVQILYRAPADLARVHRATRTIDRQIARMERLIDDLLDIARISQGLVAMELQPTPLAALVEGALDAVKPLAEATGHRLQVTHEVAPARVLVDAFRAEQVVVNLLSNAIKYSPPGSRVRVSTDAIDGQCRIAIADEGQGIRPEHLSEVFTMFARPGIGAKHGASGMGVGLALAKQLAEQQGGRIEASSDGPGRGATFCVWFVRAEGGTVADNAGARTPQVAEVLREASQQPEADVS